MLALWSGQAHRALTLNTEVENRVFERPSMTIATITRTLIAQLSPGIKVDKGRYGDVPPDNHGEGNMAGVRKTNGEDTELAS